MGWLFSHFFLFRAIAESTMIIGADVSHAAPGMVDMASMTAMIASLDKNCPRYGAAVQSKGKEKAALVSTRCFDHLSHGGSQMRVVGLLSSNGQISTSINTTSSLAMELKNAVSSPLSGVETFSS